ncbi:MAG: CBS domain-containing protein [Phycisphaeraceae bacterium]|nr:CBS domain-containing protein [Phycisphaeraceae bacterium]MCW5763081.1 CBS domain-containing protein [Phycisphaeraceae bacterium]
MDTVRQIIGEGGQSVHSVAPTDTVLTAAQRMNDHHIGSLVVLDGSKLVGIVTERDVMRRVVATQRDPMETSVREIMTADVLTCSPKTSISQAKAVMRDRRIRHLPVCEHDRLVGIISIGDLNAFENHQLCTTLDMLEAYISQA